MTTIAVSVEYDGTHYHGWQIQHDLPSIQAALNKAISSVADQPIESHSAGRTDRGVHATGQVVHFVTTAERSLETWLLGVNANLPPDIRVTAVQEVSERFHARYSAIARRYQYLIINQPVKPALYREYATWHFRPLDVGPMQLAAPYLLGEHDFNAYRAVECQSKTSVREIQHLNITRRNDIIIVDVQANAFLHHMVRNIVGVLLEIGEGKRSPLWAKEVLHSKDRTIGGVTAKPCGLYFIQSIYPPEFEIKFPLKLASQSILI